MSEQEVSLASTLAGLLVVPDLWSLAARRYADAVDEVLHRGAESRRGRSRTLLTQDLGEWHDLLLTRLTGPEHAALVDRLSAHPVLATALRDRPADS